MADWFKFYENDLDETRLRYAIRKLPEVTLVWLGILSECCRHKSDTVRWGSNEIELFGFSDRLGVSIPKVNEGVRLLTEIDYITHDKETITVLKWAEKQSEYCQKKASKQAKESTQNTDSVPTVSRQCRPRGEEKRGEEITGEEKKIEDKVAVVVPRPTNGATNHPPLDSVLKYFKTTGSGYEPEEVDHAFNSFEAAAIDGFWLWGRGRVTDWRASMSTRLEDNRKKFGSTKKPLGYCP